MRFANPILVSVVAILLGVYAFDCDTMTTPEQAMQCCNSMPCSAQGHQGQDCCKSMPSMHSPFVQVSAPHGANFSVHILEVLPTSMEGSIPTSMASGIAALCHAPPISRSPSPLQLRI
jgi:hypothetical protein